MCTKGIATPFFSSYVALSCCCHVLMGITEHEDYTAVISQGINDRLIISVEVV